MSDYNLIKWGVTQDMDDDDRRVTMLSNVVYLMILAIVIFYLLLNFPRYLYPSPGLPDIQWIPLVIVGISVVCLLLNRMQKRQLSKLLFTVSWISFTNLLVPVLRGATESSFISMGVYAVISSALVHILFSWRRERVTYVSLVILTWIILLFFVEYLEYFRQSGDTNQLFRHGFFRWRLIVLMTAAFFNGAIVYIIRVNQQLNASLVRRNETIEQQNRQLAEQRERLVALAAQLRDKVEVSTTQLSEQHLKLSEYSYFNSHILRAPVSRIRGLIHLLSLKIDSKEEAEVRDLLAKSMKELDEAIKEITERLNEGQAR